jgi:transcriptional regulator with XRE-family HTH domain
MSEHEPGDTTGLPRLDTLAEKIEYLFQHRHPGKDSPFTLQEVVARARELGGPTISLGFLHALRTGKSHNPTIQHLQALSAVFNVPLDFFINDDATQDLAPQLRLLTLLQERGVTSIALRAADLNPAARQTLLAVIEALERQAAGGQDDRGGAQ